MSSHPRPSPQLRRHVAALPRRLSMLVAATVVIAACSDTVTGEYLESVSAVLQDMEAETFAALPRTEAPTRERIDGVIAARAAAADRLRTLEAPSGLATEHEALVITLDVLVDEMRRVVDRSSASTDEAFVADMEAAVELTVLAEAVGRACRTLQAAGSDAGHDVDLAC